MAKELTEQEQIELELKRLELEERQQSLESRKIQDELARLQLGNLKQELETKTNNKKRGAADAKAAIEDLKAMQARCNHHTGGEGAMAITQGQGDIERPSSIGAQQFLDDRIRLFCQRCRAECFSDDPDRQKWAYWVNLWRRSINKQMMVVGGLKIMKQQQVA
jgi:hypothetical protein